MKTNHAAAVVSTLLLVFASCSEPPTSNPSTNSQDSQENAMAAKVYDAYEVDEDDQPEKLGRIAIDNGKLSIMSLVDESERESIQRSLDDLNNRPFLVEKAPPKDGERYDIAATEYERGQPGFDEVLIRKLESSHSIRLEPAK